MAFMPTSKTIKTKQVYTLEEVFETLKKDANLPAEPYIQSVLGMKAIQIPGTATQVVEITVSKKPKISVHEGAKPSVGNFVADQVTGGWSSIVGRHVSDIKSMVEAVAAEVERLFGK